MPWQPDLKDFQRRSAPQPLGQRSSIQPIAAPAKDEVGAEPSTVTIPSASGTQTLQYEMPVWRRSAFTLDPEYMDTALTVKPLEELLAIAYLRSVRSQVTRTGLSYLASYSGRHRCLAAGDLVLMADGSWKNIENIQCGDAVRSPQYDGKVISSTVTATHRYYEENVYDVIEANLGNKKLYTCSKDHKIPMAGDSYSERTAEELSAMKWAVTFKNNLFSGQNVPIRCVKTNPQTVHGFTLDSLSGLFITNSALVTHNSK